MPRFEPFPGIRYDLDRVDLDDVVAPPYDVVGPEDQAGLEARSPYNVVRIDLPHDEAGRDRYEVARRTFDQWLAEGILSTDPEPGFYVYRMGYHDPEGQSRQIVGVLGALEVSTPAEGGDVLPHEETQHRIRDDRLRLLRACRADLSPVWGLSLAEGLTELCSGGAGAPVGRCTDDEGVHHRLWRLSQPGVIEAVSRIVGSAPVVIADGHHRYATALAHRDERRAAKGTTGGAEDLVLALVCELTDGQASVRPIHRVISGLPEGFDLRSALEPFFEPIAAEAPSALPEHMAERGGLGLVIDDDRGWVLVPRAGEPAGGARPDAALLDEALATLPAHELAFEPSLDTVVAGVASGKASGGVLLRPVDVRHIATTAVAGRRMPTKTTFFHPKPRTGMVFRRLDD